MQGFVYKYQLEGRLSSSEPTSPVISTSKVFTTTSLPDAQQSEYTIESCKTSDPSSSPITPSKKSNINNPTVKRSPKKQLTNNKAGEVEPKSQPIQSEIAPSSQKPFSVVTSSQPNPMKYVDYNSIYQFIPNPSAPPLQQILVQQQHLQNNQQTIHQLIPVHQQLVQPPQVIQPSQQQSNPTQQQSPSIQSQSELIQPNQTQSKPIQNSTQIQYMQQMNQQFQKYNTLLFEHSKRFETQLQLLEMDRNMILKQYTRDNYMLQQIFRDSIVHNSKENEKIIKELQQHFQNQLLAIKLENEASLQKEKKKMEDYSNSLGDLQSKSDNLGMTITRTERRMRTFSDKVQILANNYTALLTNKQSLLTNDLIDKITPAIQERLKNVVASSIPNFPSPTSSTPSSASTSSPLVNSQSPVLLQPDPTNNINIETEDSLKNPIEFKFRLNDEPEVAIRDEKDEYVEPGQATPIPTPLFDIKQLQPYVVEPLIQNTIPSTHIQTPSYKILDYDEDDNTVVIAKSTTDVTNSPPSEKISLESSPPTSPSKKTCIYSNSKKGRLCLQKPMERSQYCWFHAPNDPNSNYSWCKFQNCKNVMMKSERFKYCQIHWGYNRSDSVQHSVTTNNTSNININSHNGIIHNNLHNANNNMKMNSKENSDTNSNRNNNNGINDSNNDKKNTLLIVDETPTITTTTTTTTTTTQLTPTFKVPLSIKRKERDDISTAQNERKSSLLRDEYKSTKKVRPDSPTIQPQPFTPQTMLDRANTTLNLVNIPRILKPNSTRLLNSNINGNNQQQKSVYFNPSVQEQSSTISSSL